MSGEVSRSRLLRTEREADWHRLEDLLDRLDRGQTRALSDADLLAIPVLYRSALSSLSMARATILDRNLVDYLESLSTRGYFAVYGARAAFGERIGQFFARDWPEAAQALGWETIAAFAALFAGIAAGYLLTGSNPEWFYAFVPAGLASGRDPEATTAFLRNALRGTQSQGGLPLFATYLFTHNTQVAIMAFSLGFAFCLPSAFLLAYSGGTVGAFLALYAGRGLGPELGGWLLVHGVTELLAVVLAGAGGFHIGTALVSPGRQTRLAAAARAGKRAVTLMAGVMVMLLCAGLLEGIVRQRVESTFWRYAIAAATAVFWALYLYILRRLVVRRG